MLTKDEITDLRAAHKRVLACELTLHSAQLDRDRAHRKFAELLDRHEAPAKEVLPEAMKEDTAAEVTRAPRPHSSGYDG